MPRWSRSPMLAGSGTRRSRAWLTGTTRNLARTRLRRREPLPADIAHIPSPDEVERQIEETALRDWLWEAINGLSEPLRHVVVLRYFSTAASYDAIAAALGIPTGTVRSRLHAGRTAPGCAIWSWRPPATTPG
jgi:RNA polymerase sigma factor (sigma-70 family)